ncbi:MAG: deoxyribose-phosphate aldolase [Levilactobacillus sp.]|jgi:deoxyribose-phosphate aldolase|uniref:deoxyribose-phosphate aldolase n=1 Tax=Levilactobacillus sp. TaxID=2767919 RepID=UPI00258968F6|nr:deoxyribose-phosphate aldolase [Levilactobacillus sp.]MCI1554331.1 deoxyribose-phosphate aldolase [Levilactobacillus sp.]MCI1599238.1 deoxyribose-phosphate aldolase [Levilactobacillus sp.]MCI1605764.1 deoxyribose-phosphate aldolase [Levilactobacillus sp.]
MTTLNRTIDHTLLAPEATQADIDRIIREAKEHHFRSVMLNPYWVAYAHQQLADTDVNTDTVIGFPLGANTTAIKVAETKQAIHDGVDEIDVVMNIGEFKSGHFATVTSDLKAVIQTAHDHDKLAKVIIETALLSDAEITRASELVVDAGAEFVKTSTGFSTRGASVHDVILMKQAVGDRIQVKASGGVHTKAEAEAMLAAGATRLGTSSGIAVVSE